MTSYCIEQYEYTEPAIPVVVLDGDIHADVPATVCRAFRVAVSQNGGPPVYRGRYATVAEAAVLVRCLRDLEETTVNGMRQLGGAS